MIMKWVNNGFSQKMLLSDESNVNFKRITEDEFIRKVHRKDVVSCIGHKDTAEMFGLQHNRTTISLNKGDVLFVCDLNSPSETRLPEGTTRISDLPDGFKFKFWEITVL